MDKEKLTKELMDIKLKLAIDDWVESEGERLYQENEDIKSNPSYQPSDEARAKFNNLLNHQYKVSKIRQSYKFAYKIINKIAMLFVLICIAFIVSVFSVEAVRVKVVNLFLSVQDSYTEINLQDHNGENIVGDKLYINWKNAYVPTKIPKEFFISKLINSDNMKSVEYSDSKENIILFQQRDENSNMNMDTEDSEVIEKVSINNLQGVLITKDNLITITWVENSFLFILSADENIISKEVILEIASSVKLIN